MITSSDWLKHMFSHDLSAMDLIFISLLFSLIRTKIEWFNSVAVYGNQQFVLLYARHIFRITHFALIKLIYFFSGFCCSIELRDNRETNKKKTSVVKGFRIIFVQPLAIIGCVISGIDWFDCKILESKIIGIRKWSNIQKKIGMISKENNIFDFQI